MAKTVIYRRLTDVEDIESENEGVLETSQQIEIAARPCNSCEWKSFFCKFTFVILLVSIIFTVYVALPIHRKNYVTEENNVDQSIMQPYQEHFGTKSCKNPVHSTLSDIVIAINFNHPHYSNIPILLDLYRHVFPHYVICGPEKDPSNKYEVMVVKHPIMQRGFYGYQCLVLAMKKKPGYVGYLYVNDDMIINWWSMLDLDTNRIWTGKRAQMEESTQLGMPAKTNWWKRANTARRCTEAFNEIENDPKSKILMQQYFENTENERICVNGWSDIFYIPGFYSETFAKLSTVFYDHLVFVEAAVQTMLLFLDNRNNMVLLNGLYLPDKFGYGVDYTAPGIAWQVYTNDLVFIHPYKFDYDNTTTNKDLFKEIVVDISDEIAKTSCLDIVNNDDSKKRSQNNFKWSNALGKVDWSAFR